MCINSFKFPVKIQVQVIFLMAVGEAGQKKQNRYNFRQNPTEDGFCLASQGSSGVSVLPQDLDAELSFIVRPLAWVG